MALTYVKYQIGTEVLQEAAGISGSGLEDSLLVAATAKGGLGYSLLLGNNQEFNTFFLGKPHGKRKEVLREAYEELIEAAPTAVKKQAGKAVRPFNEGDKRKSIPRPAQIDWSAFERDQVRVAVMLELWQELIIQEEEELLLLLAA